MKLKMKKRREDDEKEAYQFMALEGLLYFSHLVGSHPRSPAWHIIA
jgi:hypothetical protein